MACTAEGQLVELTVAGSTVTVPVGNLFTASVAETGGLRFRAPAASSAVLQPLCSAESGGGTSYTVFKVVTSGEARIVWHQSSCARCAKR